MNGNGDNSNGPIRVMVVDDSAVVRGLVTRMLEEDKDITVVASVGNGQAAVGALDRHDVEVIILDIEMPVMDGLTALPLLLEKDPKLQIIMASTLTTKNAEISLMALSKGACDYIPKPSSSRDLSGGTDFRHDLLEKVRGLAEVRRHAGGPRRTPSKAAPTPLPGRPSLLSPTAPLQFRPAGRDMPDVIAIGSSTGGPQALFKMLKDLRAGGELRQPILLTQHMPATFTTILAEHITRQSGIPAKEATDGEVIAGGRLYLAPGDYHMVVETQGTQKILRLDHGAPVNFCRPAVDPMFQSIARAYGSRVLAVVLTGMGSDGARGAKVVADGGGTVLAQDEASSVVWGMPGATAQLGICSAVLPLDDIAQRIRKIATGVG